MLVSREELVEKYGAHVDISFYNESKDRCNLTRDHITHIHIVEGLGSTDLIASPITAGGIIFEDTYAQSVEEALEYLPKLHGRSYHFSPERVNIERMPDTFSVPTHFVEGQTV